MQDVHVLRRQVLVDGRSRRQVAYELGISRKTVRRYLELPEPVRREQGPRRRPVLDAVQPRLDELLSDCSERTTPKQRLTATRLHRQLRKEGYAVGVTTVRDYSREWRRQRVSFIRAADLVRELLEACDERTLTRLHQRYLRVALLIVDELGFVLFDRAGGELLSTPSPTATSGVQQSSPPSSRSPSGSRSSATRS